MVLQCNSLQLSFQVGYGNLYRTMARDKRILLYSTLLSLVFGIGNTDAQICGGNYTTDYGVFASPNYPDVYDYNLECTYRIALPNTSQITINFETFELDRSPGDLVSITCESKTGYRAVRKNYTWDVYMAPIWLSSCRIGRLDFFSDSNRNYSTRGFKVQYQASTIGCGTTTFTAVTGTISSPNYPEFYNSDENCTYSISALEASSFTLRFLAFDLESDCERDWVQIICDNSSYISPKYCGSNLPRPANISNCNKVLVWFHTDHSHEGLFGGFSLQYSKTPIGCGKADFAVLSSGIITSPNYPKDYNGIFCSYELYPVGSLALAFQSFDLEPFIDDLYGDYVSIECVSNQSYGFLKYVGNTLPPLISFKLCSRVRMYFYPNYVLSGTGFNLKYQVNPLVAQGAITNAPKNLTIESGSRMQLDCTTNATGYLPSWTLSRDGTEENAIAIASFCVVNVGYTWSYSVVSNGPGVCNLIAENANEWHAGIYTCIDASLASSSSVLAIIDPNASSDQGLTDSDIIIIVLSVFLAIFAVGFVGIAIAFVLHRRRGN